MAIALLNPWLLHSMGYIACDCIVYFFLFLQLYFPTCGDIEFGVIYPSSSQYMSSGVASAPLPAELRWCFLYCRLVFIGTFLRAKAAVLSFLVCNDRLLFNFLPLVVVWGVNLGRTCSR